MRKILLLWLIIISSGCYSRKAHFIQHGYESYPPKPDNYEVIVFDKEVEPDLEYTVIGLVVVELATSPIPLDEENARTPGVVGFVRPDDGT